MGDAGGGRFGRASSKRLPELVNDSALRAIVHDNPDGMILVDQRGTIRYANPSASEVLGRGQLIGHQFGVPIVADEMSELDVTDLRGQRRIVELRVAKTSWDGQRGHLVSLRDVTDRKNAERDLRSARDRADAAAQAVRVLEQVGDGVFLVDPHGTIELWNAAAQQITGLAAGQVVGRRVDGVLPGWDQLVRRIPISTEPGAGDRRLAIAPLELSGQELWLSIAGVRFVDGTVYAFRDITEERRLESLKTDFIATVSHELRTPVTAIYGALETITRPDLPLTEETRTDLVDVAHDQSARLARLVDDILAASYIDSGKLAVRSELFDLAELADAIVTDFNRTVSPDRAPTLALGHRRPALVTADRSKVQQVINNLLENAVKYSPDGGPITLHIEHGDTHVRCEVRDGGIGITPADQRRIFEKFFRVDANMVHGVGGTGLGLYICRELIQRMGGRIGVRSRAGTGSTFWFTLPASVVPGHDPE